MTTYERICRERCQWCAAGKMICEKNPKFHWAGLNAELCTAPTRDEVIEQQAEHIAELEMAYDYRKTRCADLASVIEQQTKRIAELEVYVKNVSLA